MAVVTPRTEPFAGPSVQCRRVGAMPTGRCNADESRAHRCSADGRRSRRSGAMPVGGEAGRASDLRSSTSPSWPRGRLAQCRRVSRPPPRPCSAASKRHARRGRARRSWLPMPPNAAPARAPSFSRPAGSSGRCPGPAHPIRAAVPAPIYSASICRGSASTYIYCQHM